jgi:hypothetical protein
VFASAAIGAAVLFSLSPVTVRASDELRRELAGAARDIAKVLRQRGETGLAVGQFSGPASFPASGGPGIALILAEELQKQGITVKPRARLGVRGQYHAAETTAPEDPRVKLLAVRVKGTVEDAFNNVVEGSAFERTVRGEAAVVELLGAPAELSARATPEARARKLRQSLDEPHTALAGKRIAAAPGSPYAVEILVEGKPRAARDDDGLAFIDLDRATPFAVRLINDSDREAAVRLTVDGLSVFAFTEHRQEKGPGKGEPLYSVLLVPAKGSLTVRGWHRTNESSELFAAGAYGRKAEGLLKQKEKVGTITAAFAAAWPEDALPPADEAPAARGSDYLTGSSPGSQTSYSAVRRKMGVIRSAVSVRYNR